MPPSHPGGSPTAQDRTHPDLTRPRDPTFCHPCSGIRPEPRITVDGHDDPLILLDVALCPGHYQQLLLAGFPWLADEWAAERERERAAQRRADCGSPSLPQPELPAFDPTSPLAVVTSSATAAGVAAVFAATQH